MMLEHYRERVRCIDDEVAAIVLKQLRIRKCKKGKDTLFKTLDQHGYDQADLVLCLLRINTTKARRGAELLIGHQIKQYSPVYKWKALPVNIPDRAGDQRRVLRVVKEPRLASGRRSWLGHYHLFKEGLSVAQLMCRGITANDLRLVTKRGWVQLSAA
jgi:hypothetical protein